MCARFDPAPAASQGRFCRLRPGRFIEADEHVLHSADDTRAQLLGWAELQRVSSVHLLLARRVCGSRTVRLAGCRNALLGEAVALGARFLVMLDLDCKRALPDARPYGPPCWRRACLVCRQR